jgi:hypothetical protein
LTLELTFLKEISQDGISFNIFLFSILISPASQPNLIDATLLAKLEDIKHN